MRTNLFAGFQLTMKNHLLATWALMPEIIRHLRAAKKGTDFGTNKFGEPGHEGENSEYWGRRKASGSFLKKRTKKLLLN
jgi:hypothetical protein